MMRKEYDLVFSLGARCACSLALRNANLQFSSFPFDWVACSTFRRRIQFLLEDFRGWLELDRLVRNDAPKFSFEAFVENTESGILFVHDFGEKQSIAEQFAQVREKYLRRINRLLAKIAAAKTVLIVWVDVLTDRPESEAEIDTALARLQEKWPHVHFDFLHFVDAPGVSAQSVKVEDRGPVRTVHLDYHDAREKSWTPDHQILTKWLQGQYAAVDYRTRNEKQAFKRHLARHEFCRYRATGWLDYVVTKYSYKLYKHLRTRLSRRGVI